MLESRKGLNMHKRLNITLPEKTLRLLDRVAKKGDRSRVIAEAVERYVDDRTRKRLKERLKQGAIAHAERDRRLAEEWSPLDEEAWERD